MLAVELIKMLITDEFGDKIIQLFVTLVILIIVCLAWWSTNIREQPHFRTVFLLERRLRRRIHQSRLTTHIQSSTIVEGEQVEEVNRTVTDSETTESSAQNSEQNKPPTATTSSSDGSIASNSTDIEGALNSAEDEELVDIVRIMDADTNVVRNRRLAYYENLGGSNNVAESDATATLTESEIVEDSGAEVSSSPEVMLNDTIMEHNYAERDILNINLAKEVKGDDTCTVKDEPNATSSSESNDSNIRIKLKYLNDDLKLVDGRLEEQLGDFKRSFQNFLFRFFIDFLFYRRHFHLEFSSNKLVRLIFNGQVLQPDTETLQSCGLFDNCVVHCLIHQQRNAFNDGNNDSGYSNTRNTNAGVSQSNSNQGRDWDLGNILFVLISVILGSAWYFRYEYAHLYTVTATVALVAITGIFTVFLIGLYFPDPVPMPQQAERESTS